MTATVSLFGTIKPMRGDAARIQHNALSSWTNVDAHAEVLLIGDDEGAADLAGQLAIQHITEVERSPLNVPLLNSLFDQGQRNASADICVFANADIIFTDDLLPAIEAMTAIDGPFLGVGQRWDLELDRALCFDNENWGTDLRSEARDRGNQDSPIWIDWFAFRRGQFSDLPPFVVGRPGYDHWLVADALHNGVPVIDASDAVMAIHQHHEYTGGRDDLWSNPDSNQNQTLIGARHNRRTIANADLMLNRELEMGPATGIKYRMGSAHAILGPVFERSATLRHRIGLDTDTVDRVTKKLALTKRGSGGSHH